VSTLRIATRRSALARAQAFQTGHLLQARTGREFELVAMATAGDLAPDRPVGSFDLKGLFVDTIRDAVLSGDCDVAVHSYKDLPSDPVPGLRIAAVPEREDPRDVLVSRSGYAFPTLPALATVGTSSARRRLQLLRAKPALQVLPLRGNLDTRLRKVAEGEYDAIVVAFAGLRRLYVPEEAGGVGALGLPLTGAPLEPGEMLPAAGQGALALECRSDDEDIIAACREVDDPETHLAVRAERAFQAHLGGGCLTAIGALGRLVGDGELELAGMIALDSDPASHPSAFREGADSRGTGDRLRRQVFRLTRRGPADNPEALGVLLADDMKVEMA
jgi:hydroxymethylbilane synthase